MGDASPDERSRSHVFTGFGEERRFAEELLRHFPSRISDALELLAAQNRVLLLATPEGIGIDAARRDALRGLATIERSLAGRVRPGGRACGTCSAEDLDRPQGVRGPSPGLGRHRGGFIVRQRGQLRWDQLDGPTFGSSVALKEEPEILDRLAAVVTRAERVIGRFRSPP